MSLVLSACNCGDEPPAECEAFTCESLDVECGMHDDNCGETLNCGSCQTGFDCEAGVCVPCQPMTCEDLEVECDTHADGCGGTVDCGGCETGYSCQAGTCEEDACVPQQTCTSQGIECGPSTDECGNALDCGGCDGDDTCQAGTCVPPACVPKTCEDLGAQCGVHDDDCGGTVNCGGCLAQYHECQDGTCVCVPRTCEQMSRECGTWNDGCGGTVTCGPCTDGATCREFDGMCITPCVPRTCEDANAQCGYINDECGNVVYCGNCEGTQICGADAPNQCGDGPCTPATCESLGYACGSHTDGCGDFLTCGPCADGERCDSSYQCVDAGLADGAACTTDDECAGSFCITEAEFEFKDGYCSGGCESDADCTSGAVCTTFGICAETCTQESDCRGLGYICLADGTDSICWRGANGPGAVGAACEHLWDCGGGEFGFCVTEWGGGYCSMLCGPDEGSCPTGSSCWDDFICLDHCNSFDDCRTGDGYTCFAVEGTDYCIPGCETDADCTYYCETTNNICVECLIDAHCATGETCVNNWCEDGTGTCDFNGYSSDPATRWGDAGETFLYYEAWSSEDLPSDDLHIVWLFDNASVPEVGVHQIDPSANLDTCTLCVFLARYDASGENTNLFFARQGEVEITQLSSHGQAFAGELRNAVMADWNTEDDIAVTGGQTWCVNSYTWSVPLEGDLPDPACTSNADCSAPTPYCNTTNGACVECLVDTHCSGTDVCHTGSCAPLSSGTAESGDACVSSDDCGGVGAFCYTEDISAWEDGYCLQECSTSADCFGGICWDGTCFGDCVSDPTACRDGYDCAPIEEDISICYPYADGTGQPGATCFTQRDCTGGFYGNCINEAGAGWAGGYCIEGCQTTADCTSGLCFSGTCYADCTGNPGACRNGYACADTGNGSSICYPFSDGSGDAGAACNNHMDCTGGYDGVCWTDAQGYPGGYCTAFCQDDTECSGAGVCVFTENWGQYGRCVEPCEADADCSRSGYTCYEASADMSLCWPDENEATETTIIEETLRDGSMPAGWTANGILWKTTGDGYAHFDTQDAFLHTPVLDLTGYTEVTLQFSVAKFGTGDNGPITVDVSNDGGATWTAQTFESPTPGDATYMPSGPTLITPNSNQVVIRFSRPNSPSDKRVRDVVLLGKN